MIGRIRAGLAGACAAITLSSCATPSAMIPARVPTVVLISLDGFRWDYLQRAPAVRLRELAARGVRAERLIPSFPSKTFPNHYTLVTGLYPENHGISANIMRDSVLGRFATGNNPAVRDGRWYSGEPIWATAERQGVRSAVYFWPGSEAEIGGIRPSRYFAFNNTTSRAARVDSVVRWLSLADASAPRLIAAYFEDVDTEGHNFGPDSPQTDSAIARVDSAVGAILDGISRLGANDRVNVIIVSDHGMSEVSAQRTIALDDFVSLDSMDVIEYTPVASIVPKPGREMYVLRALQNASPNMQVYRKGNLPERLHYNTGPRIAPIIAIAADGWTIGTRASILAIDRSKKFGAHGYDPELPTMGALFVAAGPAFRSGAAVPPFTNVHVYSLLARLLNLRAAPNDGSLDSVRAVLR